MRTTNKITDATLIEVPDRINKTKNPIAKFCLRSSCFLKTRIIKNMNMHRNGGVSRIFTALILFLLGAIATASAQAGMISKGDILDDGFIGSSVNTNLWSSVSDASGTITVGSDYLKLKSPAIADGSCIDGVTYAAAAGGTPQKGFTLGSITDYWVEIKFAVLSETGFSTLGGATNRTYNLLTGLDSTLSYATGFDFRLSTNNTGPSGGNVTLQWFGNDNSATGGNRQAETISQTFNKDTYYTLSAHRKTDGTIDIFVDGLLIANKAVINGNGSTTPVRLRIGDGSSGINGTLSVDYVRIASVQEPNSTPLPVGEASVSAAPAQDSVNIGSRRELFLDNLMVDRMEGGAQRVFHHPVPREVVITFDKPWEGNACGYLTVFRDSDRYRMYYVARNVPGTAGGEKRGYNDFACYAESPDGIHWTRPSLGLVEFNGSKDNNIIPKPAVTQGWRLDAPNPFRDENPAAAPDAIYKAIAPIYGPGNNPDDWTDREKSLAILKSPDGIHWTLMQEKGVFHGEGFFDSQNVAFWDQNINAYRAYFRDVQKPAYLRDIKTGTSPDFVNWSQGTFLTHVKKPSAQFYTNGVRNYHRAPHIYIGLPDMYEDRPWSPAMEQLPDTEKRRKNIETWKRPGPLSEVQLMWSRDGGTFELSPSTFMPPGPERPGTYTYYDVVGWHLVETASDLEGAAPELTLYCHEFYAIGDVQLRRYTLRLDGFASVHAPIAGGELVTPPLIFKGSRLSMNFASSAFGSLRVELQDAAGKPIPGFTLDDSIELYGDTVARNAMWKNNPDLGTLAGKPVRLRFVMRDADLYSIKFEEVK